MAVNRKTLLAALAGALLVFSMLGCGATNHLQSVTLGATLINGEAPTGQTGFYALQGNGGTIQLAATANYSNGKPVLLHGSDVTYTMIVDPNHNVDAFGNLLPAPPKTAMINTTGLVTAVEPATCTFVDDQGTYVYVGAYLVTASFQGITSQPVYIPVASSAGPSGACLPTSS
jgi:hypothetical protein